MPYVNNSQPQPSTTAPTSKISTKANELFAAVEHLHALLNTLEERLQSVTHSPTPEPASNLAAVDEYMCEVAQAFNGQTKVITAMISRIQSVLDRLEI